MQQEGTEGLQSVGLAMVFHALGRKADSDDVLRRAERDFAVDRAFQIACAHALRGEPDAAFQWLDRAYSQRDPLLEYIKGEWTLRRAIRATRRSCAR
jgi:hypothetical protein